ncbi:MULTISPECIES: hypothetical protein [unclassified Rhizobium]|uniref:hypothetical protein n=1 Tax=unclassified Rhizobium TaxID=2613769 RepID=UPI0007EA138D|nr:MULTISPECIES: hypothetical protein [unclassified Rhizobium]ANM09970.1 hypothetical protein AMK05_CH01556 [Rhizobium sp. N324]ANM16452.1 hypothetical protein AMK06_CH01524 [Rhizobium sp. N541]ANM22837.1 hypothetical protein AMK07_CH01521 [Rhizobium sp. N941]OYD03541.1 hypothetical protein AMK08_CH101549 [Rhizobium sp. N4311]
MTIFGQSRLTRITYAVLLLLMFCFDFAKDPIQRLIVAEQDQAARELMAPRPASSVGTAVGGEVSGKNMPLMFKGQEELVKQIAASGRKPTAEDMENLRAMAAKGAMQMTLGVGAGDAETAKLVARRSFFETLYMVAAIAMTAITIVGLLYIVSGRLRDIGWPQYLLWGLLAPVFLPKFLAIPLPALAIQGITFFFYGVLLVLAFISGEDSSPPTRYKLAQSPTPAKRRPGQFGRLGTQ